MPGPPETVPVPFVDLRRELEALEPELEAAFLSVLRSGRLVLGPELERFEAEVAAHLGAAHAVGVASGTDALRLVLEALGVGPGDEVVTSPFTFAATAGAVLRVGAVPVFAEIDPGTFLLDPGAAEAAITPRTAALLPVHLFGQMAEIEAFQRIAERHGLAVVEDAAQALGATRQGVPAGTVGAAGCFSFYPTKNVGAAGDAGLVVTDDVALAERLRQLRNQGRDARGRHREVGWNSRLDELQAALLRVKLRRLEEWTERRRAHAAAYDVALRDLGDVTPPRVLEGNRHVYHQYTVRCRDREAVRGRLERGGIGYAIYYPVPLHREPAFEGAGRVAGELAEAEQAAREVLSLPVFPQLQEAELDRVIAAVRGCEDVDRGGSLGVG